MTTLATSPRFVKSAVLFDATRHVNRLPAFGRGLTTGFAARQAERDARKAASDAFMAKALADQSALYGMTGELAPMPAYVAEGYAKPLAARGYDATDSADLAAGRTMTAEQWRDRQDAEDEMRLMSQCPAEVDSEYVFEA